MERNFGRPDVIINDPVAVGTEGLARMLEQFSEHTVIARHVDQFGNTMRGEITMNGDATEEAENIRRIGPLGIEFHRREAEVPKPTPIPVHPSQRNGTHA